MQMMGAAYQYGGGGGAPEGDVTPKLPAEGGDVKKLSQKFGGGVLGKVRSFVKGPQDSLLVQGAPNQPAAAAPYLYAGQVAPSSGNPPHKSSSLPPAAISDVDELSSGEASVSPPKSPKSPPMHKKPGYVPPKQWRPPLQMLLHQHNGRIIAIPHVDALPHGQKR